MKRTFVLLILSLALLRTDAHPLHLSITNITYENGKLNVIMKTFRDDWEIAYFHYHSRIIDFTERENREIPWFRKYLASKFRVAVGQEDRPLQLVTDTLTLDGDDMTIQMHAGVPGEPISLYIYNALLTDIYPDQTNLVIFGDEKRQTGIKFDIKTHEAEVPLR